MLNTLKTLTYRYGTKDAPFGFQYIPGSATFAGFCDVGVGIGASFDGRKKGQPVADDFSPQNFLMDLQVDNTRFRADPQYL
jgi:pyruvate-formate lyase